MSIIHLSGRLLLFALLGVKRQFVLWHRSGLYWYRVELIINYLFFPTEIFIIKNIFLPIIIEIKILIK